MTKISDQSLVSYDISEIKIKGIHIKKLHIRHLEQARLHYNDLYTSSPSNKEVLYTSFGSWIKCLTDVLPCECVSTDKKIV